MRVIIQLIIFFGLFAFFCTSVGGCLKGSGLPEGVSLIIMIVGGFAFSTIVIVYGGEALEKMDRKAGSFIQEGKENVGLHNQNALSFEKSSSNPIENQRIKQQHTPLLTEEMMSYRIAKIFAASQGFTFEQLQHTMRFDIDANEHQNIMKLFQNVLDKEKQFVKKHGFNMTEEQVNIAFSHLILDFDEDEMPYW